MSTASKKVRANLAQIALFVGGLIMFFPFIWMASTACKSVPELASSEFRLLPEQWSCRANVAELVELQPKFFKYMGNTAIVTVARVIGQFIFSVTAAYGFARYKFPFKNVIFAVLLAILMVPAQALVIPQFVVVREFGLFGTLPGIFVPNLASAFSLFLFRQAFEQLPIETEEAAMIDGAGTFRMLFGIVLPMARPAVNAFLILNVIAAWNDFFWPLVIANTEETRVATIAVQLLNSRNVGAGGNENLVMMASLITILPVVAAFIVLQRRFVEGLAASGIKG